MRYRRTNKIANWWEDIDSVSLILILAIIVTGILLISTASPPVAARIGLPPFYFLNKHLIYLFFAITLIIGISMASETTIKRFCLIGFALTIILLIIVLLVGDEAKGAKRWISILGFSLQPSEIVKPFYAVIIALILSEVRTETQYKKFILCALLHIALVSLVLLQPDFGMTMTISLVAVGQFFVAGFSIIWLFLSLILFIVIALMAYKFLPHVQKRVASFLSDNVSESYQVAKSLESYIQGGFLGKGPGEGTVKLVLPDAHTDFIFAVVGEEFGALSSFIIIGLFATVVLRGLMKLTTSQSLFNIYASTGILMYFAIQSIFNIGVTLHLFPTKGMTLPFISYGGSSMISFACAIGIYLSLTKRSHKPNMLSIKKSSQQIISYTNTRLT